MPQWTADRQTKITFAVSVADLDAACAALRADGCKFLVEPRDYQWGRSAYLRDPDGRLVEVAQS